MTGRENEHPDVVGVTEIARRLNVRPGTVDQWRHRGVFPDPAWTIGGRPAWSYRTILRWAILTGRVDRDRSA